MKRKYDILSVALLLLVSVGSLQSCQKDDFGGDLIDRETLITRGQYLTAGGTDAFAIDYNKNPQPFPVGTPYRLLAFSKANGSTEERATHPRFNKVAWEGELTNVLRYINIERDPDKWFGFTALDGETGDRDGLVSLDFYGFTYGEAEDHRPDYLELDGISGETTPVVETLTDLNELKHTETVTENGDLRDLMRGELLNQNISTAGVTGTTANGTQIPEPYAQSVLPFKHCFTKLRFQISQQGDEDNKDAKGNPTPRFDNLYVDNIEITGSYGKGVVSMADGKVNVSDPTDRTLKFNTDFDGKVEVQNNDVGEILIFPSDGADLSNADMTDGYDIGLRITMKSTVKKDIENMLINTGSTGTVTEETDATGVKWYKGAIEKDRIIDFYNSNSTPATLYFRQNTSYMMIITFQKDAVRIITVIPMVEQWLPGEGTVEDPWQDQAMGQPQMFDNIVWSDRNLGANHYDPSGSDYEQTVGYFYQAGRNIPYYPFKYQKNGVTITPDLKDLNKQDLVNGSSSYSLSQYRFYPVVDRRLLRMTGDSQWCMTKDQNPQMDIPEAMPTDTYFDFSKGSAQWNPGLDWNQDMHWEDGQINQPTSGSWKVPTSQEFLTVFPSTPHAGNITFRTGAQNSNPMGWVCGEMGESTKVLRVTVPYYYQGMEAPAKDNASTKYTEAWTTLKKKGDPGCTTEGYSYGPGVSTYTDENGNVVTINNPNYEPDGDPEDGFASVYVISREGDDKVVPEILQRPDSQDKEWSIKSWGTIYAIKRIYTPEAYRMRWRVINAPQTAVNPCFYVEICRYRCESNDELTVTNYKDYDWDHPAATIYFPICGLGDWTGEYINFGTECQYATSDKIENGRTSAVQIKVSGTDSSNSYIAVVKNVINRTFGMQIRPVTTNGGRR